jgi:hypothetical protein
MSMMEQVEVIAKRGLLDVHPPVQPENGVYVCDSMEEWERIHDPGTDLLVWNRTYPALTLGLEGCVFDELPTVRFLTTPQDASGDIEQHLGALPSLPESVRALWIDDMRILTARFFEMLDTDSARIRMEQVTTDQCRRFHTDNMTVRLICTYIGPTTQWLSASDIIRQHGQRDQYSEDAIQHLPGLSVGLLKGRKHLTSRSLVYHRSPPVSAAGLQRFVLCIDDGRLFQK